MVLRSYWVLMLRTQDFKSRVKKATLDWIITKELDRVPKYNVFYLYIKLIVCTTQNSACSKNHVYYILLICSITSLF